MTDTIYARLPDPAADVLMLKPKQCICRSGGSYVPVPAFRGFNAQPGTVLAFVGPEAIHAVTSLLGDLQTELGTKAYAVAVGLPCEDTGKVYDPGFWFAVSYSAESHKHWVTVWLTATDFDTYRDAFHACSKVNLLADAALIPNENDSDCN